MVYIFKNKKTKLRNWNQLILKRRRTHFLMYARSKNQEREWVWVGADDEGKVFQLSIYETHRFQCATKLKET